MKETPDFLKRILTHKRREISRRRKRLPLKDLREMVENEMPPLRAFYDALESQLEDGRPAVVAEIKKASPSKGVLRENFDPKEIAVSYADHGATCLSVLTDREFFQGAEVNLEFARKACSLPALRKDFIIEPYQVYESRLLAADCVLLIVAATEDDQLEELYKLALELDMDVLIEVHNQQELERALRLEPQLIGINNRDLCTFDTRLDTTLELVKHVPADCLVISESGINTQDDVKILREHGIQAFLVGEAFMRARDPGSKLAELFAFNTDA